MRQASTGARWTERLRAWLEPGGRALGRISPFDLGSAVLLAAVTLLVCLSFNDYGIAWDEKFHVEYGDRILDYYVSGDTAALRYGGGQKPTYGGGFDVLGAIARRLSPLGTHETLHLLGGLVGVLGLLGAYKLGRLLAGPAGGFWSAVLLTLTPVYYGHSFNNPKDAPFAVGYVWAVYYIAALVRRLPSVRTGLWVKLSLALGAAMCVRVAGIITVGYLLLAVGAYSVYRGWAARRVGDGWRCLTAFGGRALLTAAGGWVIMIACWPWALQEPIRRPLSALRIVSNYYLFVAHRRFGDGKIWSYDVPWDYLPRYFGMKLPELVLLLLAAAAAFGIARLVRLQRDESQVGSLLAHAVLATAIVLPPAVAVVKGSALYDGLRHFLFVVPVICVAAAVGSVALAALLRRRALALSLVYGGAVAILCADQVRVMAHLHPHEYVYYNAFAGGLAGAADRYDVDYYGNSYKEAFEGLQRYLWQSEKEAYLERSYAVTGCFGGYSARHYLPPNFRRISFDRRGEADFFLGYRRGECHLHEQQSPVVFAVERFGTPIAVVRDRRSSKATKSAPL